MVKTLLAIIGKGTCREQFTEWVYLYRKFIINQYIQ